MKFRLVEDNELKKRAKYHSKRQKGLSPFYSPDGGNIPLAIDKFNNSVADGANGLMEDFLDSDPRKLTIDIINYLQREGYRHPNNWISNSWVDLKDGVETGIDDLVEVAENIYSYIKPIDDEQLKLYSNDLLKYLSNKSLKEAWFTPLSEISSFTGWIDDDSFINEEERFNSKVEKSLNSNRNDIYVLIDEDFQYDPRTYEIEDLLELQDIKTKNIRAKKFVVNDIEFIFEDASSMTSPRLYFKSEDDGQRYVDFIDHYYDEV